MTAFAPAHTPDTGDGTSFNPTNAIAAGHGYTIAFGAFTDAITAITADNGDTIIKANDGTKDAEAINTGDGNMAAVWWCASSNGGNPTFTVTSGGATAYVFTEWNQAISAVRSANNGTGHSTAVSSGSASATAGDVAVAAICTGGGDTFSAFPTTGWTDLGTPNPGLAAFQYQAIASSGSVTSSLTIDSADGWSAAIAVLEPAASSPVTKSTTPAALLWAGTPTTATANTASDTAELTAPAALLWAGTPVTVDVAEIVEGSGPPAFLWAGTPVSITTHSSDLTITVVAQAGNEPPRNQITVTGAAGTAVPVTRVGPDGAIVPVRGADPAPLSGGEWIGFDYEMPYGAAVTYTVVDGAGNTASVTVAPLGVTQPWLIHPGIPSLSQPLQRVTLSPTQNDTGATQHGVLGRRAPITVTDGTRKADSFTLGFRTEASFDEANMDALLRDTSTLLLQIAYTFTPSTEYQWVQVGAVSKTRLTLQFGDDRRVWAAACTVVDRPAGGIAAQRTWADVLAEGATWQDILSKYATWGGVLTGIAGT